MTAPDLSPAEASRVAEFDAAVEPAEVTREKLRLAEEALARVRDLAEGLELKAASVCPTSVHACAAYTNAADWLRTAVDGA